MVSPENKLFCRLDGLTVAAREQQRLARLTELELTDAGSIPIFEEATQTAARFLEASICVLSIVDQKYQWFRAAVGLSHLGLMNELATSRQLLREDSLCTYVVDSHQVLAIDDTLSNAAIARSLLVQQYGIRSYLGAPLMSSSGHCLGTLAIFDLSPRAFTSRDAECLELIARWSVSEYERSRYATQASRPPRVTPALERSLTGDLERSPQPAALAHPPNLVKVQLLNQLTQELRTPLTSVLGMTSVLNREIYGPLTSKQKEYLNVIHCSGQYLLSLVNEILELGNLNEGSHPLSLTSVDIEMLCQQAINSLAQAAQRQELQVSLSIEPGNRIWVLDKEKVRQVLYHLLFSVIQAANAGSIIRVHVSRKADRLNIAIWVTHPWLGEGLPYGELYINEAAALANLSGAFESGGLAGGAIAGQTTVTALSTPPEAIAEPTADLKVGDRENLRLLLSCYLTELHGGQISLQGTPESGYRYVIELPSREDLLDIS